MMAKKDGGKHMNDFLRYLDETSASPSEKSAIGDSLYVLIVNIAVSENKKEMLDGARKELVKWLTRD